MRRLLPKVRFSLRSIGLLVLGVAAACGWLLASQNELDRQLEVVRSVGGASDVRFFAVRSVGFTDPSTITNRDVAKLAALPDLEELYLPGAQVDDEAAEHFAKMQNLRILVLQNTKITDKGLQQLAELPNLEELRMSSCDISDKGK